MKNQWFYKIDIPQAVVAIGLVVSLLASLYCGNSEQLSMCIASGLIGYIGGNVSGYYHRTKEQEKDVK